MCMESCIYVCKREVDMLWQPCKDTSLSPPFIGPRKGGDDYVFSYFPRTHHKSRNLLKITLNPYLSLQISRKPPSNLHIFENLKVLVRINLNPRFFQAILIIQRCFQCETSYITSKSCQKPT
ncbi:hypothetical protein Hanom_Chr14g01256811 [Helianthus anomalus]